MSHNFKNNDYNIGHSWNMKILDNEFNLALGGNLYIMQMRSVFQIFNIILSTFKIYQLF